MRSPVDTIAAPGFPKDASWVNVATLRMEKQVRHPVLVEFFDVCRPSCLRTLPYLRAWHERYAEAGLRVIGVHAPGFPAGRDEDRVREAIARLDVEYPVMLDPDFLLWRAYAAPGWPSRYLWAPRLRLFDAHHGEGDYHGTERAIQELLGIEEPLTPLVDPTDDDDVPIVVPTADVEGPFDGAYAAGEVWVVVDRPGTVLVNDEPRELDHLGAHRVIRHERHTAGELRVAGTGDAEVLMTAFLPGLA